ncbi:MAG: glycosyltransferase family 4 protein [Rudaea sp.]
MINQAISSEKGVRLDSAAFPGNGTARSRLLFVTPRYPPFTGGVENHVYQVARRLAPYFDVTVLTTDPSGQLAPREEEEGVTVRRVRAWPSRGDFYLAPDIFRVIRDEPWDLVHIQSFHTLVAPLAMLAARQARIPYVLTFHGGGHSSRWRHSLRGAQRRVLRPLLAGAERLVAVARFEIDAYGRELGIPRERFALIPNGCDLQPARAARGREHARIASIGRLEEYKGHHRILRAMPEIIRQEPEARLWIAGSGPYEPELRRLAAELGMTDRVDIQAIPAAERERMAEELSRVSLAVLLSEFETQPIALLEALALGCSALVADTSGLREMAEAGLARAIPLNSTPEEVARAAVQELRAPARAAPVVLPTWDDCARDLRLLYESVLDGRSPGVVSDLSARGRKEESTIA